MIRSFGCALGLGLVLTAVSPALAAHVVTLPGGTALKVKAADAVSSATAQVGETFEIRAVQPVLVDGWVVIPEGSRGQAEVVAVHPAEKHGIGGKLEVKYDWVYSADGGKIQLSDAPGAQTGISAKGASSTATIASTVILGPVGLFAHNFVKGRDVVLDQSRPLQTFTDHTVHVSAQNQSTQTGGYDK